MRQAQKTGLFAACILVLTLAACGFKPVYAPGSPVAQNLSDITPADPYNHVGYLFVRDLEERIGHNPDAGMLLKYDIAILETGLEIDAARVQISGEVGYHLISRADGSPVTSGSVTSFVAYSPEGELYVAARRDALERLMRILADKTVTDLMVKLSQQP